MAFSQAFKLLWATGIVFMVLPHVNLGLLSDYKICGDSECQSLMSRVQAIRDYRGKDCRFLSFRRGDTIFVYHKLTGKRDDLWAGSIDKQFGYFPKDAVQEEEVHKAMEKVVETQESDFFCMDGSGYLIDSSHLDSDDDGDDGDDEEEKIQNQESETTQNAPYTDSTNAESPQTSADVSTEPPVSAQEADDGTSTEEDESKNASDAAAGTHEEATEAPAAANEQGGSAPSSWLGSSVTGWLGLATEEEPGNLAEGEKKDERKETQADASFTSSVTGWLGLGGDGNPDDAVKSREEERETADSFTSTMTGWLGFGGEEKKTDHATGNEQDEERGHDEAQEPAEKFRSRRMSLDLEGSQLHEEEKKEMGTLDWLGNGLSNTLGFGLANQESEHEAGETIQEEEEQPASSSWFDTGIGNILGFGKDKSEVDDSTGSGLKEMEEDKTLEQPTGSENVDTSQSQPDLTEEDKTDTSNESKVDELPKDQNVPSEIEMVPDRDNGTSVPEDAGSEVNQEDISPPNKLEETSQAVDVMSPSLNSFFQTVSEEEEEENVLDGNNKETNVLDGERPAKMEGTDHQTLESIENMGEDNHTEPGEEEMITTDHDVLSQSDINLVPHLSPEDLNSKFSGQSLDKVKEDKTEDVVEEKAENEDKDKSTDKSVKISASSDDHEGGGNNPETDTLHKEIPTTQTEQTQVSGGAEESSGERRPFLQSGTAEEGNKPVSYEDDSTSAAHGEETSVDHSDSLAVIGNNTEADTHEGEFGQEGEGHFVEGSSPEFGLSHSTGVSTEIVSENTSEEDRRTFSTSEDGTQIEDDADQESVFSHMQQSDSDAHMLKETETDSEDNLQPVQTETMGSEKDTLNESGLKSAEDSETESGKVEESTEKEKQWETEELKAEEKQEEVKEMEEEGKRWEEEELKEEEREDEMITDGKDDKEEKQEGVEELKEEKQEDAEELKEEKQEGAEELKEEKQEGVEELKEERTEMLEEVEEVNENEESEGEDKQVQSSHFETERENTLHPSPHHQRDISRPGSESSEGETKDEKSLESALSEMSAQTERTEAENLQMEEEKREEENKSQEEEVQDEMRKEVEEKLEAELGDEEEEGGLKCSNELCPQTSEDGFVRDRDGNDSAERLSSIDEGETETGEQNRLADIDQILADRTEVSQTASSEGTKTDEDRKQEEEKRNNDDEADELGERKNSESDITGNEDVNDQLNSGESGLRDDILFDQTAESKGDDQLESSSINLSEDKELHRGDQTESKDTETEKKPEQIHLDRRIGTEENPEEEERHDDVRVNEDANMLMENNDGDTAGKDFRAERGSEISVSSSEPVESQAVISEQVIPHVSQHSPGSSLLSDGHSKGKAETESGGAFGLFRNPFSFFGQTPTTQSAESTPRLDATTGETSEAQASLTPEQEVDSSMDSTQPPTSQQQLRPSPPPSTWTSSPSPTQSYPHPVSLALNTQSPFQTKSLSKDYSSLLAYVSVDETAILMELFGRHKLQFLDYILGSSDSMTDDPDNDKSILLDIERLLHHHRETLVAPSKKLADAPQEDKEKTRTLIALHKLELLLEKVRHTFNTGKSDITNTNHQAEASKHKEVSTEEESSKMGDSSIGPDSNNPRDEWLGVDKEDGQLNGNTGKDGVTEKGGDKQRSGEERVSPESHPHVQPGLLQSLEAPEVMKQILDVVHQIAEDSTTHVYAARELLIWLTVQVVSSLPDDIRPGPDLYGVPWEPVIVSSLLGLVTVLLFTCRCYSSVKSRMYRSKERWMAEQVAQLLDEKCKVLETLSKCQQEYDDLEDSLRDSGILAQTQKTEHLEGKARQLGHAKRELERDLEQLKDQLDQQREHRIEQERRIAVLEESMKSMEEESKDLQSQEEQAQTTLKVYSMNSDRLQRNLESAGEENTLLQESNSQLRQQVEGWAERVSELEAEMSRCEVAHSGMLQDVANKDERIMSLTDRLLRMKAWDSDLEEEGGEEGGEKETSNGTAGSGKENGRGDKVDTQGHLQKVQKLIYAAKLNADLKSVDEDKDRAFAKLNDEVKAKEDLLEGIKELENEKLSLQSDTDHYSEQVQRLQQKLHIMTEMYQENELKLHRLLTVEEKERLQKEEKLNKADKNIALAMEELNNYRQRAEEMEEELEKTKQSYQTQMSAHEKKAHNNWLAARAAERELADIRRENALFRQKLTDTQFKLDALEKDPYALDSLARPLPFRAERSPYGPSPLGRPASETRAFLSPPTLMDGPPARLSPRVPRGPMEPPGGQGEMERSGGPHSDSGSISPTWERDRRGPPPGPPGPLPPPGYMFPEPGGPMYRRPPPGALGPLPPPGSLPPGPLHPRGLPMGPPHPADMADGSYRENSLGPADQDHRESGPGERRTPPEAELRMGGPPPPGPPMGPMGPMGPMDGPFPRRAPYGPPPPDFYPPRGPGVPPMMPMWAPPPPGMMYPPRFPPGGPSHPHHGPPMRPPLHDGLPPPSMGPLPPQQSLPSPPHSQSPEEHTPSPEDAI